MVTSDGRLCMLDRLDANPVAVDVILDDKRRRAVLQVEARLAVVVDTIALEYGLGLRANEDAVPA